MKNLGALLLIGLVVFTVVDVLNSDDHERVGLPQWAWVVLLILFPLVGSVVWIAVSRTQRAHRRASSDGWGPTVTASGPVAPDDDPEFLWLLDQKRRQEERDKNRPHDTGTEPDAS